MYFLSKQTILNCENGAIHECEIIYDENELVAYCELIPDEQIPIAGEYGGLLPLQSTHGDQAVIHTPEKNIQKIVFISKQGEKTLIYWNYNSYICGFSYDGNYFVLADDTGIKVLKRNK